MEDFPGMILIDPFTDPRWDSYISDRPGGTIFHTSAWARVLQDRYETGPRYYALENSQGEITALAPFFLVPSPLGGKRLVCLPCSEYCSPLADSPPDLENLMAGIEEEVRDRHIGYLEIRGLKSMVDPARLSLKEHPYYLNQVTTLSGKPEGLRSRLSRDTRYHLNRGERSQVTVRTGRDENDLKQFHRLTSGMRRRINLLPWPYRFFQSIYRHILQPGHGFLLLAEHDGEVVSGGLFFSFKETVINKFNASDARYIHLRPNYLLMWKAIERAYEQSYRYFDFGVTNPENTGLIKFKSHWDSSQAVLPYYYYPEVRGVNSLPETSLLYRAHTTLNRLLPGFALKIAAEVLYKRMG
jgi:hypothetical protein